MDRELRDSLRHGELRAATLLDRAGRTDEALDYLENAWSFGQEAAGELLVALLRARSESERLEHGARLDRIAGQGLAAAGELWRAWFPAVTRLVGRSHAMRSIRAFAYEHARQAGIVLVRSDGYGEGKRSVARALHGLSGREQLHEVEASGLSAEEIRSELDARLFGHTTVVLAGAIPDALWEDRALELSAERGGRVVVTQSIAVRGSGRFGHELTAALAHASVEVPPLRERLEDVPLLVRHFLDERGASDEKLTERAIRKLRDHRWPENVRELEACVDRALREARARRATVSRVLESYLFLPEARHE